MRGMEYNGDNYIHNCKRLPHFIVCERIIINMQTKYSNQFRKMICQKICEEKKSTSKTAKYFNVSVKTVEKWVTAFHQDSTCFDHPDDCYKGNHKKTEQQYNHMMKPKLIAELKKRDNTILYLCSIIDAQRFTK